jgi:tetratricopeptide (TPR) repeat protein
MRDEAVSAYERAFAAAPTTSYGRMCGARAALARGRVSEAESILEALIQSDPKNSEPLLVLADLLAETGRLAEAAVYFERVLAVAPWQTTAYSGLFSSKRITERERPLISQAAAQLASAGLADRQRMMLEFVLGKAEEDLGNYGEAMRHWDAANAIRSTLAPFDRAKWSARIDGIISTFTPRYFAAYANDRNDDSTPTPILVLGMPRSGSTLIERVVSSHPQVAGGGELTFWESNGPKILASSFTEEERRRVRADYLRVLRNIGPNASHVTDKMPFNFLWIGLVRALFPKARIVHTRRSAIDTCLSIYTTYFANDWAFASDRGDLVFFYREYERLMSHWRAVVPASQLLTIDYESATESPEATARGILSFLNLPWDAACLSPQDNKTPVVTANKWEARQPIYRSSVGRWRHYEPWLGQLRELL